MRFLGAPAGYEFMSLVDAVVLAGTTDSGLSPESRQLIAEHVHAPLEILVFVTPTCPHCPRAVTLAHRMAVESPHDPRDLRRGDRVHRPVATLSGDRRAEDRRQWRNRECSARCRRTRSSSRSSVARHCSGGCSVRRQLSRVPRFLHITLRMAISPPRKGVDMRPLVLALAVLASAPVHAADLQPKTVAAFNRYVMLTERRLDKAGEPFLWVDAKPETARRTAIETLRRGEFVIEPVDTQDAGRSVDIPDGLVHHWIGVVFAPGMTIEQAVALLQDYDRHADIYKPNVARSKMVVATVTASRCTCGSS